MDVLKDVKKAEEEAERIEQDYRARADELLSSVNDEIEQRGTVLRKKFDDEMTRRNAELDKNFSAEHETIVESGRKEREAVAAAAHGRHDEAVDLILQRMQR